MAENKKSFILYADLIHTFEKLPDEIAGKLMKIILNYVNDKNPVIEDLLLQVAFEPIKLQLKRDLKEWDISKKEKSVSGKVGNLKRWHKDLYEQVLNEELSVDEADIIAKHRKATKGVANIAVNDNVTVNVNDNDIIINDCVKIPIEENVFPSMPRAEDVPEVPKSKVQSAIEMLKITNQVDVVEPEVKTMWNIFKDQNLTGKRYYPDKDAVYSHFLNWIVKKDFKKHKNGNFIKKHTHQVGQSMDFDRA